MGDPRREGGGILTRGGNERPSFFSSSPLYSLMYDRKGGEASSFPRMRQKEQYKFGHKSGRADCIGLPS